MKLLLPLIPAALARVVPFPQFIQPQNPVVLPPAQPVEIVQQTPFAGMDPMMMMLLLDGDSDSSLSELLPIMMMQNGAMGGMNGMNPLLMMTLLDDDTCDSAVAALFTQLSETDALKIATGEYIYQGADPTTVASLTDADLEQTPFTSKTQAELEEINKYIDYEYISCESKTSGDSFGDLLPLMMMGQNNMASMDPMMLMLMVDDDSNDLSIPMLMAMNGMNSGAQANPLLWLTLLDDDTLTKKQCDAKYDLDYVFEWTEVGVDDYTLAKKTTGIRSTVEKYDDTFTGAAAATFKAYVNSDDLLEDYFNCVDSATEEGSDSSLSDILPLMMMNGGGFGGANGQMNPMMLLALSDSDSSMSDLLPLMMMNGGNFGANGGMDPMMMALLLKD